MAKSTYSAVPSASLAKALSTVVRASGKDPYQMVHVQAENGKLSVRCFNGLMGILAIIAAEDKGNAFEATIDAQAFASLVGSMNGAVTLSPSGKRGLQVQSGSVDVTLKGINKTLPEFEDKDAKKVLTINGQDLLDLEPEERAQAGVFLAFQYPVAIRGITNSYFLRAALNAIRKHRGLEELDPMDFLELVEKKLRVIGWDESYLNRAVNEGFSGGEKKRNEILQLAVLEPTLALLDETDSGLDIDALRTVADAVNTLRRPERATLVVTHYQRLLNYIVPDRVHVLAGGRIVKSGDKELALELEAKGYDWLRPEAAAV